MVRGIALKEWARSVTMKYLYDQAKPYLRKRKVMAPKVLTITMVVVAAEADR